MRFILLFFSTLNILFANTIQTPFENLQGIEIIGKFKNKTYKQKTLLLDTIQQNLDFYLKGKGFEKKVGKFYKKSFKIPLENLQNQKEWIKNYDFLATNRFDEKEPTFKIMINYLKGSYTGYDEIVQMTNTKMQELKKELLKDLVRKRERGIASIKKELLSKPLKISQQFFIYKNSYLGFDITFTEQYSPLKTQDGHKIRIGLFEEKDTSFLFLDDKFEKKIWLSSETKKLINNVKKRLLDQFISFYKPKKAVSYAFIEKEKELILANQLVNTAISDDSDSSRIECDNELTLNNDNVKQQLKDIDAYIYKVSLYHENFKLPKKSEGVAWKSFFWKYKKAKLIKNLSTLKQRQQEFLDILALFIAQNRSRLTTYFVKEEYEKVEQLFATYWEKNSIDDKKVKSFLASADIVDLIALGLR